MLLVNRRVGPVPGVVRTGIGIKAVITRSFKDLGCRQGFFHVPALFLEVLPGQTALAPVLDVVLDTETQHHGKIFAYSVFNSTDNFNGKGQPVL
ncbi:hypothetical protein MOOTH_26660 [Moorella thermoacetica]|uniref:Uncharacterized protein n=1 Tax=Neomoorella thermoacetica TaxID=1525 RepID=A0A1J5K3Z3_NEOTH|nr:hypothetical protein MOOR_27290 [Moorella thermoacetica]OIQ10449.1 hypothetical protein MOOTH_26660 [Moorella thermoacetica]